MTLHQHRGTDDVLLAMSTDSSDSDGDAFEQYDLHGFTKEEVKQYNRIASPSQRLKRKSGVLLDDNGTQRGDLFAAEYENDELSCDLLHTQIKNTPPKFS